MTDNPSSRHRFLPVGLDIRGRSCLVVGGGSVGARKVNSLVDAGAAVTVVSPAVSEDLAGQIEGGRVRWVPDLFRGEYLDGAFLVVAATDDEAVNADVVSRAGERGILVCDASSSKRSQVIFGALHRGADGVTVAVFTDGRDPAAARRTRDRIVGTLREEVELEED